MTNRKRVYYWKSDRPYTLGNTHKTTNDQRAVIEAQLTSYLKFHFREDLIGLRAASGQGNHVTYLADYPEITYFIRLENGPEKDNYMIVESKILEEVGVLGIPVPAVFLTDISREKTPFAIQIMEYIPESDLNVLEKGNALDLQRTASIIGRYIALWQSITPDKYGLFNPQVLLKENKLEGYHDTYAQYFFLNWDTHLDFLCSSGFISAHKGLELKELAASHAHLLDTTQGCLVHKDLALWNILGNNKHISAFIDWDDTVSGDPVDDLSLLGCFHTGDIVLAALEGYAKVKSLPPNFNERFWLHLLRNIIFKSVIRVKGNYFNMPAKFFLNNPRNKNLKQFTLDRIESACAGLKNQKTIIEL